VADLSGPRAGAAEAGGDGAASERPRDAARTRRQILDAAAIEFAAKGLDGARVDEIALRAATNKRMIYYYFGSKEALFTAVLEELYLRLCEAGQSLNLDQHPPLEALDRLCGKVFTFYRQHPEAIALLNNENLHGGVHLARSSRLPAIEHPFEAALRTLISRGETTGAFRRDLDPVHLYITIVALAYFYLGNNPTLSLFFGRKLDGEPALADWGRHIGEVLRRYVTPLIDPPGE
jgi:TetR/AcrR family transcriptional regulator